MGVGTVPSSGPVPRTCMPHVTRLRTTRLGVLAPRTPVPLRHPESPVSVSLSPGRPGSAPCPPESLAQRHNVTAHLAGVLGSAPGLLYRA